ncbi:ferredoxin--NADP reductase [Motiliproteus sediminis]|uniref:ferredoxin--NADP reductase n=1 Tax=Motiliproteus sediminis TaxID=1468178 RepID=UPI001AEFC7BB|nr:ferredoxin--NADP reductase [Motiliproteus sediminis]
MTEWVEGKVLQNRRWTDELHSLQIEADIEPYKAGQYTRLALDIDGTRIARPYSFVNPPGTTYHEFFFNSVPGGPLSNQLLELEIGDTIWLAPKAAGFLTLDEVPDGRELWLLATGTAIGPFLSILKTADPWQRFDKVVLAYAVREAKDLCYADRMDALAKKHAEHFVWLPFVSREKVKGAMPGRITTALEDGSLEQRTGVNLRPSSSQVMICGNPEMVKDSMEILKSRGLQKNLRHTPGHITVERYW